MRSVFYHMTRAGGSLANAVQLLARGRYAAKTLTGRLWRGRRICGGEKRAIHQLSVAFCPSRTRATSSQLVTDNDVKVDVAF
ncbi:hypothetical protein SKAU_G00223590 [Synaphobranchus kaupii]|uniref:Uncharacterized protein n=1 Tax=Synaphobranchus kaupii TaxID=118154 RepID=A0A9Q1FBI1_SYNKA|nr:hypothetical protein SKAU_G00223590 [Synaphobranchus kaupii]